MTAPVPTVKRNSNSKFRKRPRRFDAKTAECTVFTFKEGLLSAVAHDLKIAVTEFEIEVNEADRSVRARFDPSSLRVLTAMRDGKESPRELSEANKKEIERNIVRDVLLPDKHPQVRFESKKTEQAEVGYTVRGVLTLCSKKKDLTVSVRKERKHYVAEATVHQPDFGIRPFSAMMGTLRVKADVLVRVRVPAE